MQQEQQAGYSSQDIVYKTPKITLELPELNLKQDNLPSIPKKLLLFPSWQINSATKCVAEFSKTVSGFEFSDEIKDKYKDELQTLGNVNKVLSRHHRGLKEAQDAFTKTKKDKTLKDKSVACYRQEKRMLDILNTSSTEMLGVIVSLVQLTGVEIKDIDQVAQLDIIIPNKIDDKLLQELKKRVYVKTIKFLIQTAAKIKSNEEVISKHLQQQEQLIQIEYYQKAQQIAAEFKKSTFFNEIIVDSGDVKELVEKIEISETAPIKIDYSNHLLHQLSHPKEILQFHQFNIEDPTQYPDYQISRHYLNVIHTWVFEHLLDQKQEVWQMIIKENSKLREIFELADKLLKNIKPELQTDWMKEVRYRLDFMTNEKSKWAEEAKKGKNKPNLEDTVVYALEGHFFSKRQDRDSFGLSSLDGKPLLTTENNNYYREICRPKNKGNIFLCQHFHRDIAREGILIDIYGNVLREYYWISKPDKTGNWVGVYETPFAKVRKEELLNSDNQIVLPDCTSIGDVESDGNRRIRSGGLVSLFGPNVDNSEKCKKIFSISSGAIGWGRPAQKEDDSWISLFSNGQDITEEFPLIRGDKEGIYTAEGKQIELDSEEQIILDKHKVIFHKDTGNLIVKRENDQLYFIHTEFHIVPDQDLTVADTKSSNMIAQKEDGSSCILINSEFQIASDEYFFVNTGSEDYKMESILPFKYYIGKHILYINQKLYQNENNEIMIQDKNIWKWYAR
jgi:hypothetical protein